VDDVSSSQVERSSGDRRSWIAAIPRRNERLQGSLLETLDYDEHWGEMDNEHRSFVDRFLSMLPPSGTVLDAASGTGKYFSLVIGSGRSVVGVDHSGAMLATARERFPDVPTAKADVQDLAYLQAFDGVMCVDALETLPPEDLPVALACFRRALAPDGWLYLTVELSNKERTSGVNEEARTAGLPVSKGSGRSRMAITTTIRRWSAFAPGSPMRARDRG
jgi:SAM-dependent methyltransferase